MLPIVFPVGIAKVGDVAQLGERGVRNAEARGSNPLISTKHIKDKISVQSIVNNQKNIEF